MTVVLNLEPIYGTAPTVIALYGITRGKLLELAKTGFVRAVKENPDSRSSRIVFRCSDVLEWMEQNGQRPRAEAFEPRHGLAAEAARATA